MKMMNTSEPAEVSCHVCHTEIPRAEALSAEAQEYVYYFCGNGCYVHWRQQREASASTPGGRTSGGDPMSGIDINQYIRQQWSPEQDPEGRMWELEPWSEQRAQELARQQAITLTPAHWDVLHFLRDRYIREGQASSGRHIVEALEQQFAAEGGRRYLYTLFPHGPVTQGSIIAGLPLPAYTADPGFGSSE